METFESINNTLGLRQTMDRKMKCELAMQPKSPADFWAVLVSLL